MNTGLEAGGRGAEGQTVWVRGRDPWEAALWLMRTREGCRGSWPELSVPAESLPQRQKGGRLERGQGEHEPHLRSPKWESLPTAGNCPIEPLHMA